MRSDTLKHVLASLACAWFASAHGQTVKITPLGAHAGEYCAHRPRDAVRGPHGVRLVYDVGASVAGATDPRLGDVHVMLLRQNHLLTSAVGPNAARNHKG